MGQVAVTQVPFASSAVSQWFPTSATTPNSGTSIDETSLRLIDAPVEPIFPVMTIGSATNSRSDRLAPWVHDEQLVNLYYLNFHASHPFLLPRSLYWKQSYPHYLKAVVQLIVRHFAPISSKEALRERAEKELQDGNQSTPEMVQARILWTIALYAQNESRKGQRMLDSAIKSALRLGMHRRDFAASYACGFTQMEESMRKTWFELFVTDGCIAALQRNASFKTNMVSADVSLPCDNFIYESGLWLMPATVNNFHCSVFADEEKVFSSFCYRIEAVRLLGRVLTITGAHGVHRDLVQAVDNALAAYSHHLPRAESKAEIVNAFGELDELMFQAHAIIQYSTILLHFPRGDLPCPDPLTKEVPGGNNMRLLCVCNRQHVHSIKAIEASKTISMLAALRTPFQRHSPFLVYPVALATVVQRSVSAVHAKTSSGCVEQYSDRVRLMLGC